jgi:HD-GYP domain-containing protein (c-di-GMP phosphodiesterase class II)
VREWVLQHHERPDGRGYPYGLVHGEIRQEALILGVADAYEAMTADRPYRRSLEPAAARHELEAGRGSQFDERVLDAFLTYLDHPGSARRDPPPLLRLAARPAISLP